MSAISAATAIVMNELVERAYAYGRELAAALVLAGERAGRDRALMREMTSVAAGEMRRAVEYLRGGDLPESVVNDYERACRNGFQAELHGALAQWRAEARVEAGRVAA